MVRLKVRRSGKHSRHQHISIPYGSIKGATRPLPSSRNHEISIPYGSIKSAPADNLPGIDDIFQFLMVRLKEKARKTLKTQDKFQFLMVRLKEIELTGTSFNTHLISIPYGSIKSRTATIST